MLAQSCLCVLRLLLQTKLSTRRSKRVYTRLSSVDLGRKLVTADMQRSASLRMVTTIFVLFPATRSTKQSCVDRTQKLDFAATASDVVSFTPRVLIHKSSSSREIWRRKVQGDYQYFNSYQEPVRCLQDKLETLQSYCKQSLLNQILRVVLCKSLQLASVACLPQIAPSSVYYCSTRSASRLTSVLSVDPNI